MDPKHPTPDPNKIPFEKDPHNIDREEDNNRSKKKHHPHDDVDTIPKP